MSTKIPLARPVIGERELELVTEVLRSGTLSIGEMLERFEAGFADFVGAPYAVACSSGTAALHLSVRAAGVGVGDEVITSPFSFVASANCILYELATPVFVDIDSETLNLDPEAVEDAVSEDTKAILPVHMFGLPADLEMLQPVAVRHDLQIVEDGCEALGAIHRDGIKVGGRGNLTCFGFYPNKQLTTGEGGIVVCADRDAADRLRSERNQGRATDMAKVEHERLGFNYRLDELSCALGVAQLERLDQTLADRSQVARWYSERLEGIEGLKLLEPEVNGAKRSWFVYAVELPQAVGRDRVIERLAEAGVASKAYMPPIHLMPFYQERFGFKSGEFPNCERAAECLLALPFFPQMREDEVEIVTNSLKSVLELF